MYRNLVNLVVGANINKYDLGFKFYIDNSNITRYRESAPAQHVTSQRVIIQGCATLSLHEHIQSFLIFSTQFIIDSYTFSEIFYERTTKFNSFHFEGIPSCL